MKSIIFHEPKCYTISDNLKLLRVQLSDDFTKLDFGYQPHENQEKRGRLKVFKTLILRIDDNEIQYKLIRTVNIPIYPNQISFETSEDWLFFSLYFEPLPSYAASFTIIEPKRKIENDFKFFEIELDKNKGFEVN